MLDRLAEIGVLTPNRSGYDQDDVKIIEAIASFRAGGYEEALGFTVYDTLRYREALEPLVQEEVRALLGAARRRGRGRAGDGDRRRRASSRCASCSARCTPSCCSQSCGGSGRGAETGDAETGDGYQSAR